MYIFINVYLFIFLVIEALSNEINFSLNNQTLNTLLTIHLKDICVENHILSYQYSQTISMQVLPSNCRQEETGLKCLLSNTSLEKDESVKAGRNITCSIRMKSEDSTPTVSLINSTELLHRLSMWNETNNYCALVMFYAPWCTFCARLAPSFNALSRAYPQLDFMAINAISHTGLNARYGSIAVPNILLFHNSKAIARFNATVKNFDTLKEFIYNITNLKADSDIVIEQTDFLGPLPSTASIEVDYLLILSWCFVILLSVIMFLRSRTGYKIFHFIASFGQEHQRHHVD